MCRPVLGGRRGRLLLALRVPVLLVCHQGQVKGQRTEMLHLYHLSYADISTYLYFLCFKEITPFSKQAKNFNVQGYQKLRVWRKFLVKVTGRPGLSRWTRGDAAFLSSSKVQSGSGRTQLTDYPSSNSTGWQRFCNSN